MKALRHRRSRGFSLLELLVSSAIIGAVLIVVASAISTMQNTWLKVRAKADVFRTSRTAAETLSRRLTAATLCSRWVVPAASVTSSSESYERESDLHFFCGPVAKMPGANGTMVGHGIFFQAPFGVDIPDTSASQLNRHDLLGHALNAWGYFVELGSDEAERPAFMAENGSKAPARRRFRLMEFRQPTDELAIFRPGAGSAQTGRPAIADATSVSNARALWMQKALKEKKNCSVLAENVIALFVRPITSGPNRYVLAPKYEYDTRMFLDKAADPIAKRTRHRLPPALELTIITVAEDSWAKVGEQGLGALLQQVSGAVNSGFINAAAFAGDLASLRAKLDALNLNYRVIVTDVPLAEGRKEYR